LRRGIHRFDGRAAFTTWSYRVATNACLDELRRRRRRPIPGLPEDVDGAPPAHRSGPPDGPPGIEGLADRMAIDDALTQLAPEFRAAVVLRDLCDLDYAEIASVLDLPPGTVRSRIARGRAQLAAILGPRNQNDPPERPTRRASHTRPPTGSAP